jgi:hypothetical protein
MIIAANLNVIPEAAEISMKLNIMIRYIEKYDVKSG